MSLNVVVSYSWFRNANSWSESDNVGDSKGRVFGNYLRVIVRAHHAIWGTHRLEIAHDDRVMEHPYFPVLVRLQAEGLLTLRYFGPSATLCGKGGMMERMAPAFDPEVDYCFCRDVDSIPLPRDRRACEEFMASGKAVHVIHGETGAHSGIMGGTLGLKCRRFRELIRCGTLHEMIDVGTFAEGENWNKHGGDQHHLARNLWPMFRNDLLLHELHHPTDVPCADTRGSINWPMPPDIPPEVAERGDSFSKIIGGCADVEAPYAFYDALPLKVMDVIRSCEVKR